MKRDQTVKKQFLKWAGNDPELGLYPSEWTIVKVLPLRKPSIPLLTWYLHKFQVRDSAAFAVPILKISNYLAC